MKALKFSPPPVRQIFLLVACFSFFLGCQKMTAIESEEIVEINKASADHNKMLVEALLSGKKIEVQDTTIGIAMTSNNTPPASTSDYTVSLVNGMLKFNSANGMLSFLAAMDTAISNWDPTNDPELDGAANEKLLAGNPTKNAFDAAIGLNSLRKKYEMAFYDDNNYKNNLPFIIDEEDSRTVLNDKHEVQIGTTIYKFMCNNVVAEILNEDYTTLQFLRDNPGIINSSTNLKLKNATTGEVLPTVVPTGPQGECMASLTYYFEKNYQGDYRQVYLAIFPKMEKDANTVYCGWFYNVAWGDGFATAPPNNVLPTLKHTYNVNPSPGECNSFNITFNVQAISCSNTACNSVMSPTASQTVNICNEVANCGKNTNYKESSPVNFTYGGIQYRIIGGIGAQHSTRFWPRRDMIYSRTFWQKQVGTKWYPTSNKSVYLTARVYGPVFKNECTTVSQRERSTTRRREVHVTTNDYIGEEYGYTRVDPNVLKSDHKVFIDIGNGYTATISGFKLQ